jgi:hypothetical protein
VSGVLSDFRFDIFALAVFAGSVGVAVQRELAVSLSGRKYRRWVVGT